MIAIEFIKRYWQPLAIALLITICYLRIAYIKSERDSALQTIANMQLEAIKKNAEVALLKQQGKRDTDALQASHIKDIQHIGSLYGKVINNDKKSISNYRTALADKLRQQSEDSDKRVSKDDANKPTIANSNTADTRQPEDSDTNYRLMYLGAIEHIKTLKEGAAVCATDYNTCKAYVDKEQKRIGVYAE